MRNSNYPEFISECLLWVGSEEVQRLLCGSFISIITTGRLQIGAYPKLISIILE